jgi:hypothetical protein
LILSANSRAVTWRSHFPDLQICLSSSMVGETLRRSTLRHSIRTRVLSVVELASRTALKNISLLGLLAVTVFAMVSSANACERRTALDYRDIKYADAVVIGRIENYRLVSDAPGHVSYLIPWGTFRSAPSLTSSWIRRCEATLGAGCRSNGVIRHSNNPLPCHLVRTS